MSSFLNIGRKLQALTESRTLRYQDERIKAENIRFALGITYPTYLKYRNGDIEPSEIKVKDIETRLNGWTNITPKVSINDLSDAVSIEDFCSKFGLAVRASSPADISYVSHADKRRLLEEHPFDDFSLNLRDAKLALRRIRGLYRLFRNNGKGAPILQSIVHVKGLLSQGKKVQLVATLAVPSIGGERESPYPYTGLICANREVYYWFFNQDDEHRRDFIILVTTKNGNRSFGGEYVSVGQDYFPIPQAGIVGMERIDDVKLDGSDLDQFMRDGSQVYFPEDASYLDKLTRLYELNSLGGRGVSASKRTAKSAD